MKTRALVVAASAIVVLGVLTGVTAQPSEVKVLSAVGRREVMLDLGPRFERATGHRVAMTFDASGVIVRRIETGETVDVVMILRSGVERLSNAGKITPGSVADLASSIAAVAVRHGAPKPDISSVEAFTRMLLDARTVARPNPADGGASGVHIENVLKRLGILDEVGAKTLAFGSPGDPHAMPGYKVTTGQADIGLHQLQELLAVPGIDIVGPFPKDLQGAFMFSAGVAVGAKEADASTALINFLRTPDAAAIIKAKGMDPATR
jgi:molybdate transport system substrate-binding protein